ncbi:hypothetical protein [Pedobacter agri]|uniref:hypothetical protein n=1 Tax=Pedobacter agri TaxID=454586 RepID=UPI00293122F4|nr:hypothetical protein [Pedobacter agri]
MYEKIEKLDKYLKTEEYEDFYNLDRETIFWVDWREFDDSIIQYCEKCLKKNSLKAEMKEDSGDLKLTINYENKTHIEKVVDRDRTIITLNEIIQPKYEIRFCKVSDGSDTLAFLPLSNQEWGQLIEKYGEERINKCFEPINQNSVNVQ